MNLFRLPDIIAPMPLEPYEKKLLGYMNIAGKKVKLVRDNRKIKRNITKSQNKLIKLNTLK